MIRRPYTVARVPMARAAGAPSVLAGAYTGTELQPHASQLGATAAFALPSRVGRRRLYRNRAVELISDGANRNALLDAEENRVKGRNSIYVFSDQGAPR